MPKQIGKHTFFLSKYYLVNPWKKKIKTKAYDSSRDASYEGCSNVTSRTYVGIKGDRVINLIRHHKFKVVK